ncbi:aminodeoxychorismate synthase component I [Flavobacteriaceae bacterium S0825]|uniref:aminodeoxychorismate synthase component I n=1 Tax=Gaetbulibacter sp. S0825 TaxID=2720084 RepID=UPI0014307AAC|nr:aminodeoxychorismate synthase component I [Gaetbulibacter sp. S0825]MCK0109529.1 aminodeoxychorismate synthase component I [Flavobacteriaceae bacterium S0825]NIX65163.1 aminodeoxychorismate synthase component I [Gaetbulibacter sp. S0825]
MRKHKSVLIKDISSFKEKLLLWSQQFDDAVWLDSNNYQNLNTEYDAVLAIDAMTSIQSDYHNAFDKLHEYQTKTNDWIFGYLSYDLKNDIEQLASNNFDGLEFPELYFFQPKKIFLIKGNRLSVLYLNMISDEFNEDLSAINAQEFDDEVHENHVKIHLRIHKDEYFNKVNELLSHIHRGDIYEANFCQEFYAEDTQINPVETYKKLNSISRPPFATFLKVYDKFLLSASPERYIKKKHDYVVSQPIKGTSKRSDNAKEDALLIKQLSNDEKERSENIMIVDLVRNDLSKTAIKGSVQVEELCKVYTFDQVHQMISSVSSRLREGISPVDVLRTTFPMGSMTGAPKISAMKIIEELEETKRGLYSGAVGYFTPDGDFDFNVIIRSILYNATKQYVSYSVGGAITAKSDPLKEYEECLVKAKAMREVLEH